ncbi:hypothetical protein Tcan_12339 [Toxocara canis]|uniref:Uncharacterized protein n=1 Tax=Toxocara canis TaxID=6265 RepID=A0A0B2UWT8_TOXCA|nr:hypothetical protein Tcan_12339 [Toxocara canis]
MFLKHLILLKQCKAVTSIVSISTRSQVFKTQLLVHGEQVIIAAQTVTPESKKANGTDGSMPTCRMPIGTGFAFEIPSSPDVLILHFNQFLLLSWPSKSSCSGLEFRSPVNK